MRRLFQFNRIDEASRRVTLTVIAPPILVDTWANGISSSRSAALKIATSPVPPWPEWQALIIDVSIGYKFSHFPVRKPTAIIVTTIDKMVMMLLIVNAAISLSHGVIETPIANKSG